MLNKALLATAAALAISTAAQAQVAVSVWTGQPTAASDATLGQAAGLGSPNVTTTTSGINFSTGLGTSDTTTVGQWLGNPALSSATLDDSYMVLTGSIYLNPGANPFTITHDDGVQLSLDGGIGLVVDQPNPTAPVSTPFIITAPSAGVYDYTLSYGECCGGPAVLQWLYPSGAPVGGVPEPATWAMMLLGFAGIGLVVRKRNSELTQLA